MLFMSCLERFLTSMRIGAKWTVSNVDPKKGVDGIRQSLETQSQATHHSDPLIEHFNNF